VEIKKGQLNTGLSSNEQSTTKEIETLQLITNIIIL
jgi:hypothetical protein